MGPTFCSISLFGLMAMNCPCSGSTRYLDMSGLESCWLSGLHRFRRLPGVDTVPWRGCCLFGGLT